MKKKKTFIVENNKLIRKNAYTRFVTGVTSYQFVLLNWKYIISVKVATVLFAPWALWCVCMRRFTSVRLRTYCNASTNKSQLIRDYTVHRWAKTHSSTQPYSIILQYRRIFFSFTYKCIPLTNKFKFFEYTMYNKWCHYRLTYLTMSMVYLATCSHREKLICSSNHGYLAAAISDRDINMLNIANYRIF